MSSELLPKVRQFLSGLEQVQTELLGLLNEKRTALTRADQRDLERITAAEGLALQRFQNLLGQRQRFLELVRRHGLPADSIGALVAVLEGGERADVDQQLARTRALAAQLRHETWVHWVISHRCYCHYSELMDLIAHRGERPPTYSDAPGIRTTGGAILDAAV
jgi:hypothetical protein